MNESIFNLAPRGIPKNMLNTVLNFNKFIGLQSMEPVAYFQRKYAGPVKEFVQASFLYDTTKRQYYFELWDATTNSRPWIATIEVFLNGTQMEPAVRRDVIASDDEYWVAFDQGVASSATGADKIYLGFNTDFDPSSHTVSITYEEICRCVSLKEDAFRPGERCTLCYGTGFLDGYIRYRRDAVYQGRRLAIPEDCIMVRMPLDTQRIVLRDYGLQIQEANTHWTFNDPVLQDWDVLFRYTGIEQGEWYFITEHTFSTTRSFVVPPQASNLLSQRFRTQMVQRDHPVRRLPLEFGEAIRFTSRVRRPRDFRRRIK